MNRDVQTQTDATLRVAVDTHASLYNFARGARA